ncbi:MAG: Type 1 glutamine amidotransferase-like domain-containing protein [Candidatus Bathyarchaeia archaeon]|jgi:peptidase E
MPRIYLLGGETVSCRSAKEINLAAFEDAAKSPSVLVFPWARASFDRSYSKRKLLQCYFSSLGAGSVDFVEYGEDEAIREKLAQSDLVYLTGGQAMILIERSKKAGLHRLLKDYEGVIVGRSAGALALCRGCVTTCRYNSKVRVTEGLGLVDITLKTHYLPQKDETLRHFSLKQPIYAVPKDSALTCDNGNLSAIGTVYLFQNGQKQAITAADL